MLCLLQQSSVLLELYKELVECLQSRFCVVWYRDVLYNQGLFWTVATLFLIFYKLHCQGLRIVIDETTSINIKTTKTTIVFTGHQLGPRASVGFVSSVRSSNSHTDLLLTQHHHHPTFSDLACRPLYNNIGLSLSEPLKLYQRQSLDSSTGYMYTYGYNRTSLQDSAK